MTCCSVKQFSRFQNTVNKAVVEAGRVAPQQNCSGARCRDRETRAKYEKYQRLFARHTETVEINEGGGFEEVFRRQGYGPASAVAAREHRCDAVGERPDVERHHNSGRAPLLRHRFGERFAGRAQDREVAINCARAVPLIERPLKSDISLCPKPAATIVRAAHPAPPTCGRLPDRRG